MFGKKTLAGFTAAIAVAALVGSAQAAPLLYESFNMATGDLDGKSSPDSFGLSSSWSATIGNTADHQVTSSPALNYGDLAYSGNYLDTTATNGSTDGSVTTDSSIADAGKLADGQSLWFSVLIDGSVGSNAHSGFAFGTDGVAGQFNGVIVKNSGDAMGVYFAGGSFKASTWEGGEVNKGEGASFGGSGLTLIVGELVWSSAGETINIYTPSLTDLGNKGSIVSTASTSGDVAQGSFDTISYSTRGSSGNNLFDEIRFGESYEDVTPPAVPEPASVGMGLMGLALMASRRRR